jgi:hypothetical protein
MMKGRIAAIVGTSISDLAEEEVPVKQIIGTLDMQLVVCK